MGTGKGGDSGMEKHVPVKFTFSDERFRTKMAGMGSFIGVPGLDVVFVIRLFCKLFFAWNAIKRLVLWFPAVLAVPADATLCGKDFGTNLALVLGGIDGGYGWYWICVRGKRL